MAKSQSQELAEAGLELDPVTGAAGAQIERPRRPKEKVFHRYYPGQGELLQDYRKVLAVNRLPDLEEALQGVFLNDFEDVFGFTNRPLGGTVQPFFQAELRAAMPFEHSFVFPEFDDPQKTEVFYNKLRAMPAGTKYGATRAEIDLAYRELQQLGGNYRMKMLLGLDAGPRYYLPTIEQAFRHAILLEGMATLPDNADMGSLRRKAQKALGRSEQLGKRHAQLGLLRARGVPVERAVPGPLLSDAIQMYVNYLGPSLGFRKGRGPEGLPLTPTLAGESPLIDRTRSLALENIRELEGQEIRGLASKKFLKSTDQQRLEALQAHLRTRYKQNVIGQITREIAGDVNTMEPTRQMRALLEALHSVTAEPDIQGRSKMMLNPAVQEAVQAMAGTEEVVKKGLVGKQRLTRTARETGIVTEAQAGKVMKKVANRLGLKPRNAPMVMAIAAILSAGFMVGGLQEEAA